MKLSRVITAALYVVTFIVPWALFLAINPEMEMGYSLDVLRIVSWLIFAVYLAIGFVFGLKKVGFKWIYPFISGMVWMVSSFLFFNITPVYILGTFLYYIQHCFPALVGLLIGIAIRKVHIKKLYRMVQGT